ncbi:uncharacterized protein LOC134719161 [Mytilus trossulus]|uniref:uncharacterized protein LOC134719161 n=1 Tax=Mytilus trossulus TaxID=6551 RepID=UPI003005E373
MWTLKEYQGRKLLFSGFVGLSFDKEHDIVVCVEGNKILLHLVHKRSKGLIIPDIATSVRDCLFVTLERISEFYQSTIHCKANNKLPFHTEYSCSKLNCFTPEEYMVVDTEEFLCEHGENIKHNWRVWNQKLEQMQCDPSCPGLSEYSLDQIPSNPELLRLSGTCEEDLIHELALRLGMEEIDWRDIVKNYTGNTQMVKFLTLIHLKENYSICFGDLDKSLQEMKLTTHTLCMVRRRKQVKSRIPDDILDCIPTDEILDKLAPQIGKMVFQLGTELGLSIADLENIDKCSPDLTAQNKEVLFTWRKDRSVKPTIRVIKQALVNIRKGVRCLEEVVKNIDAKTLRAVEIVTDKIRDNADGIIQDIQTSQILDHMMTHLVISVDDRRYIEHYPRQDDQNKALLDIVIKRREPAYSVFVGGLRIYGYEDIANDLKCDFSPSPTPTSAETKGLWNFPLYKVRLQKNYLMVITNIQHENIVDHLISREVLSVDDGKKIESGKTPQERNRNLMDMLLRKNEQGYNEFLKALKKDSIYVDLAEQIEKTEVTSTDITTLHSCFK